MQSQKEAKQTEKYKENVSLKMIFFQMLSFRFGPDIFHKPH